MLPSIIKLLQILQCNQPGRRQPSLSAASSPHSVTSCPGSCQAQIRDSTLQTARNVRELKKGRNVPGRLQCLSILRAPDTAFGQTMLALVQGCSKKLRELSLAPSDAGRPVSPAVCNDRGGLGLQSQVAAVVKMAFTGDIR